jgi:hypothetical protein
MPYPRSTLLGGHSWLNSSLSLPFPTATNAALPGSR